MYVPVNKLIFFGIGLMGWGAPTGIFQVQEGRMSGYDARCYQSNINKKEEDMGDI